MQPLLESFESFLYVLVNTLPVGIGVGLVFFGIGFLFTNPRIRRYREQIANYKEEMQRMSRTQAQITTRHQDLLENLQSRENENHLLQSTLETKDEELIGLLDRLNNVAGDSEPASADANEEVAHENAHLRQRIAELTGRLRTSESALQDRKVELTRARSELARIGIHEEATAPAGRSSSSNAHWQSGDSSGAGLADEEEEEEKAVPPAREAVDALLEQHKDGKSAAPDVPEEDLDETAARIFTGKKPSPDGPAAVENPPPIPKEVEAGPDPSTDAESGSANMESGFDDQLAEFEQRLRAKEAEFFALQEQLSFTSFSGNEAALAAGAPDLRPPPVPASEEPSAAKKKDEAPPKDSKDSKDAGEQKAAKESTARDSKTDEPKARESKASEKAQPPRAPQSAAPATTSPPSAFPALKEKAPAAPAAAPAKFAPAVESSRPLAPGEQLLFRGDDPALWGKKSGNGLVAPDAVRKATKFLRLRRSDTGDSVIIRVAKKTLLSAGAAENVLGWNGKPETIKGASLLGIFDHSLPQEVETRPGSGGWGFGKFSGSREGQAYSWAGISIPRTEFEISVLSKLPDAKSLSDTGATLLEKPSIAPSTDEELVFFHSAYPEIWNKNTVDGKGGFAFHLCRAPTKTRYLKVRRADNGSAVVIPITRDKITLKAGEDKKLCWNGSNEFFFAGHHLGICDPSLPSEVEIAYGCGGYGFGHLVDSNDRQAVAWAGKHVSRTALEFIAIARDLTAEEKDQLLKG